MSFFEELTRRNVVKMAVLYLVAAWLTLQIADVLFANLGAPEWAFGLALGLLILFFFPALIFSWVYELTPEGVKREEDVDRSQSVTGATGRKIDTLIIVLLVLAIASVGLDRLFPETMVDGEQASAGEAVPAATTSAANTQSIDDKSVAVLPFANRSARDDDAFFVDGIHDDILTQLARLGSLTVISRTSVEKFRGTSQSMKEIGAVLGVKNILEGGVQRAGDRVRINVQLIDVATDTHLWADIYDRELSTANIFAIQSEISTAIAEALQAALSPEEQTLLAEQQTQNMAALEAYFLGQQAKTKRTAASMLDAEEHYKRAIALDPDYALALVGLADTYNLQIAYNGRPQQEQYALARPFVERALEINGRLGEAYIAMAGITDDNPEEAEALFKKGIELAPGYAQGRHWYGGTLMGLGRTAEALVQLEHAVRLDPMSGINRSSFGRGLELAGRFDEAREQFETVARFDPGFAVGHMSLAMLYWGGYGRADDALLAWRKVVSLDPDVPWQLPLVALMWFDLGDQAAADRWLTAMRVPDQRHVVTYVIDIAIKLGRGEIGAASRDAENLLALDPDNQTALWTLGLADLDAGRPDKAVERIEAAVPVLFEDTGPVIDASNYSQAVDLAFFLQQQGDATRANRLLDLSMAVVSTIPRMGINGHGSEDFRILSLQGDIEGALAALRRAVDAGWRHAWRVTLTKSPVLEPLRDDPRFQTIVVELEADMAAQLERIHDMLASGELEPFPY